MNLKKSSELMLENIGGKDERVFNLQNEEPRLYYELKRFLEIYQQKDYETCYSMLSYTEMVVSLCEDVRKEAGIIYPQDSES